MCTQKKREKERERAQKKLNNDEYLDGV